ncbi:DoxX family protein [Pseudoalteromonas sp. C2R02]|uniref:DoxX family protein n=1 Tax=Pseudoalteromonas sp. C2R02 TaxID=2841565 RepID=UPI001C09943F|nr:DoxX family protein [Pseudoalteromonas sp. C2R02]MBU2972493.1 DoxX family protein [Pseudoalteromonas sp. C2R02]
MTDILKKLFASNNNDIAPLVIRLTLGVIFIGHGWGKLFGEGNPAGFAGWLGSMGLEPSYLLAVAAGLAETLGGALLIAGLFTRTAASSLVVVMLVAIGFVHLDAGMFGKGGYEFQLLLLAGVVSLLIQGAGKHSVDEIIYKKM